MERSVAFVTNEKMERIAGLRQKQITLCQKLIPVGKTRENMEKIRVMAMDEYVHENSAKLKKLIKTVAREKMEEVLREKGKDIDFAHMFELLGMYDACDNREERDVLSQELFRERMELATQLGKMFDFKFKSAATFTTILPNYVKSSYSGDDKQELLRLLGEVGSRQSMFNRYEEKIDYVFNPFLKKGTVAYRILVDNAGIFYENVKNAGLHDIADIIRNSDIDEDIADMLIRECLTVSCDEYGRYMTQKDIDTYNRCIGMINYEISQYCDKKGVKRGKCLLKKLYKMILTESEPQIDVGAGFHDDNEVIEEYNNCISYINVANPVEMFDSCASGIGEAYVSLKSLNKLSNIMYGKWNLAKDCLTAYCTDAGADIGKRYKDGVRVSHIINVVGEYAPELGEKYYCRDLGEIIRDRLLHRYDRVEKESISLKSDLSVTAEKIRNELTFAISTYRLFRIFDADNENLNEDVKIMLNGMTEVFSPVIRLFNKTRNYITSKPSPKNKLKLSFNSSALGGGWSESVEATKMVFLLKDSSDNKYLGVYSSMGCRANNVSLSSVVGKIKNSLNMSDNDGDCYRKMVYYSVPDAAKDIPRIFVNKCGNDELIKKFKSKEHLTDTEFLNEVIDVIKEKIAEHPTWSKYNFNYKETYESYQEFCDDINEQGYIMDWCNIDKSIIDGYVENGCIYLFRIYNNDYSKHRRSRKLKIHTEYINYLFSEENSRTKLIKLQGGAEIFHRQPQITEPYVHKKGSILVNKHYKDGTLIGNDYSQICDRAQRGSVDNVRCKEAKYDIIKDRRYTVEQFELHFPILIGRNADMSKNDYDELSREWIAESRHTLVISRSRKHLLFATIYDDRENVILSRPLDIANGINYKEHLEIINIAKKENMQKWKSVGSDSDLMNGYISSVIKEISDMVLEYKPIVVLETGDASNKGRQLLPNRVYTQLKDALMNKLAFLVDRSRGLTEPGGLLNPYNLTWINDKSPQKSMDAAWNGIVLQTSGFYCSTTDPESGMCNLTYAKTKKEKKNVIEKIRNFGYNEKEDVFEFDYDIHAFNKDMSGSFVCRSYGKRSIFEKDGAKMLDITQYIRDGLASAGIDYKAEKTIDLKSVDKGSIDIVFNCIRYVLQMDNERFFISPVTGGTITGEYCVELAYAKNMYNRGKMLLNQALNREKVKYLSIKDLYFSKP